MRQDLVTSLLHAVDDFALKMSDKERAKNYNRVTYRVLKIDPQETTAHVVYEQVETGQWSLALFKWINSGEGYWQYNMLNASDLLGYLTIPQALQEVERHNFTIKSQVALKVQHV